MWYVVRALEVGVKLGTGSKRRGEVLERRLEKRGCWRRRGMIVF